MKLFSKYSNLYDHDTLTPQTNGRTPVAIPRSAKHRAVLLKTVKNKINGKLLFRVAEKPTFKTLQRRHIIMSNRQQNSTSRN